MIGTRRRVLNIFKVTVETEPRFGYLSEYEPEAGARPTSISMNERGPPMNARWAILATALLPLSCLSLSGCGWFQQPPGGSNNGGQGPGGGTPIGPDRDAIAAAEDPFGENVERVVYLDQGWSPGDSQRFYVTSQGSQLLPYDWFLALEQPDNERPFRDNQNILKYRYLPQKADALNPDALPVGFVKDNGRDRAWLGVTCATCHTNEIHYKNVAYRIDGGPALGDIVGLLRSLTNAIRATRDEPEKFDRFARKVLVRGDTPGTRNALKQQLTEVLKRRAGYDARNFPPGPGAGYGRIDAFGAILNEVFHRAVPAAELRSETDNTVAANAPVSIPFLWDTPQHDLVQWNGSAESGGPAQIKALGRNVGEVLGVFGDFDIPENPTVLGYSSSVQVQNLRALEEWVATLWSPEWPAEFPAIDASKKDQGRNLFVSNCKACHEDIDRRSPTRKVKAKMFGAGTDPLMADNFTNRVGKAGKLEGSFSLFFPLAGERIPADAPGASMLKNAVIGTIVGSPFRAPRDELTQIELNARVMSTAEMRTNFPEQGPRYKGRPLNGIWATAPYLHNGSVPSLEALLRPAAERPKTFSVGTRRFDPATVGFKQDVEGVFVFHVEDANGVPIPGNSNQGHEYGTTLSPEQKAQLLEYLKSL